MNDADRWARVQAIFDAALERARDERDAFVRAACRDQPDLEKSVQSLLEAHSGGGDFLRVPPVWTPETASNPPAGDEAERAEPIAWRNPRYRLLNRLGSGGNGDVFRALDQKLRREVAIKLLRSDALGDGDGRARLLREARTASTFNHPNICTIYEVDDTRDPPYIVMELVDGRTLKETIGGAPLPPADARRYGRQLAEALGHAHERHVVHRDFKSANVVITRDGRAKVLDFGLARRLAGHPQSESGTQSALTGAGVIVGTLPYMAPELFRGHPADSRSDVWAFGIVLFEMLAGRLPFHGRTPIELGSHILTGLPSPLPAQAPASLAYVVERCLRPDPSERFPDGNAVVAALDADGHDSGRWRSRLAPRRLAVLPLHNLSGDPEHEYFAQGTHEALITDLAALGALRVIARPSVIRYRDTEKPPAEIGQELHADLLLTGTVTRQGDHVRLTVQLVDAATEHLLWARRYDRQVVDVLSLQSEIVMSVAKAIELEVSPAEERQLAKRRTVDPDAYEAYLKGRFHWYKTTRQDYDTALAYYETARQKDPGYALPYAGIAATWMMRADAGLMLPRTAYAHALPALADAMRLGGESAEVHEVFASSRFLWAWDWAGAEAGYRRAIELNPNYADAHMLYADFLISMQRRDAAVAEMARALDLDPLNTFLSCFHGWHLVYRGECDEAVRHLGEVLRAEPTFSSAHLGMWGACFRARREPEALDAARRFFEAIADHEVAHALRRGLDASYSEAMAGGARVLAERASRQYVPAFRVARLYAHAANPDRALEWLERAFEQKETPLIHLGVGWDWDGLRSDPRFTALLDRIGLPARSSS